MTMLSPARKAVPLVKGLKLVHRGKVRDTYELHNKLLLSVATDAISIFDFVLNATIPWKGIILNCMNHFWSQELALIGIPTHLVAVGPNIDQYLHSEQRHVDLQRRAIVVRKLNMAPVELVFRDLLTGSGWKSYQKNGTVCGHALGLGLQDGDRLPCTLFTPTTKAQVGHDEPMSAAEVEEKYPKEIDQSRQAFEYISGFLAGRGIVLVDTKFEAGEGILADEIGTPDSSRFWSRKEWQESRKLSKRQACSPLDKELVRNYGKEHGLDQLKDPEDPEQCAKAHALELPEWLVKQTTQTYRYIFWLVTGLAVEDYLTTRMGVETVRPPRNIVMLCGSDSDIPSIKRALDSMKSRPWLKGHVISCHHNPLELAQFARALDDSTDAIICAGGKAFALPGVLDAHLHALGKKIPVVGVALGEARNKSYEAAKLSIEELPGTPVVIDEIEGGCYAGEHGLTKALYRAVNGEMPPMKPRTAKPIQMDVL